MIQRSEINISVFVKRGGFNCKIPFIAYGIYNSSTGSIIIGSNREKLVSKENPYIKGVYKGTSQKEEYGIYNLLYIICICLLVAI